MVELLVANETAVGSNPILRSIFCGYNSVVESQSSKLLVVGSIPIARSILAPVAQSVEVPVLETVGCQFESDLGHQSSPLSSAGRATD